MGEAIRKTVGTLAELTVGAKRAGDATQKLSEENLKRLGDVNAELSRQIPQSWNTILDAIVNKSGAVGTAVYELSNKLKGWAGDIIGLVDTIPGHFGDAARKVVSTVDQWINFADRVLAILHRMNEKIPESMGGMIESVIGIFKKSKPQMQSATEDWAGDLLKMSEGGASDAGDASGKGFAEGFLGKLGLITSGLATFFGSRGQGKVAGVIGGAMAGAQIGTAIAPGIGTAIGAIAGGIAGLFGSGKSKEQKEAEENAKKQAALDMQRFVADLNNSILDGLNKGFELLEKLQGFSEVPRKAIKRFLNEIFQILRTFVEMSAQFKAEGLAQAKLVSENLGGAFSLLLSGADLVEKIRGIEAVTQADVDKLFTSVDKILDGWFSLVEHIEKGTAKRAGKIGGLLQTSLETIQLIPATIKAMTEVPDITDEQIDKPFVWGKRILDKFFALADEFKTLALNRTVKTAEAFQKIFESGKSMFEFFKLWSEYKPLDETIFDAINSDFDRVRDWFTSAISKADEWLSLEETLEDRLLTLGERMSNIGATLTGAFNGGTQNFTLQQSVLAGGGGSTSASGGFSSAGSASTVVNVHVAGSLIHQSQLQDVIVDAVETSRRRWRL
jgi:hypothetical protein